MPFSNTENDVWNDKHNGCRVPINDTGIEGAPAALKSSDPSWERGSINKAVVSTWNLENQFNPEDVADSNAGVLDLLRCTRYVNKDMLYGFNQDSRGKVPGDAMSFRGYPTAVVAGTEFNVVYANSIKEWSPNGALGEIGEYSILSSKVTLAYKLPYAFQYTITLKHWVGEGQFTISTYEVQIASGHLTPTHYREVGETTWNTLSGGLVYLSVDTSEFTTDKLYSIIYSNVVQTPYYNTLSSPNITIELDDYRPPVDPLYYSIGFAYFTLGIINIDCFVNNCNEILGDVLGVDVEFNPRELFLQYGATVSVGADVFLDIDGINRPMAGKYVWAHYSYSYSGDVDPLNPAVGDVEDIYRITQYIEVNSQGVISKAYTNVTGPAQCWIDSICS